MKIYKLSGSKRQKLAKECRYINIPNSQFKFEDMYGFRLSNIEIIEYYQNLFFLEDFLKSKDSYALILENLINPNYVEEVISKLISDRFDIIILRNEKYTNYVYQMGYALGYKWCDLNYLVSKDGASKVLHYTKEIDRSFCDNIILLSYEKKINVQVLEDTNLIFKARKMSYNCARNQEILRSIICKDRWNDGSRILARELISLLFFECRKLNLHIFLNEGSLLGCIRHGQIMPWDDDIDIAIEIKELELLFNAIKKYNDLKMEWFFWKGQFPYCKIWMSNGQKIEGYDYMFPFIDVWIYKIVDSSFIRYNFGEEYPLEDIFPLKECYFENSIVKIPNNSLAYLDKKYSDWRNRIVYYPFSHQFECTKGEQLEAYISVDSVGYITNESILF